MNHNNKKNRTKIKIKINMINDKNKKTVQKNKCQDKVV